MTWFALSVGCAPPVAQQSEADRQEFANPSQPTISWAQKRKETPPQWSSPGIRHAFTESGDPPAGFRTIKYPSRDSDGNAMELLAWLGLPNDDIRKSADATAASATQPLPAVVYFHSGHELGASDCREVQLFLKAGFAVLLPSLRGENGNPGNFELFWGEVDDGLAAINWLAEQKEIDRDRIYTFGHSAGGGISALLSLVALDAPIRFTGSCGGLYQTSNLRRWEPQPPFTASSDDAFQLRTLVDNVRSMNRRHYAYLGLADPLAENGQFARSELLHKRWVLGDHFSSLPIAATDFAVRVFEDAFPEQELPSWLGPLPWKNFDEVPVRSAIPDRETPSLWNVTADPAPEPVQFFRGSVRCEIQIRSRQGGSTDLVFPRGFEAFAKYHALNEAPKPGVTFIDLSTMVASEKPPRATFPVLHRNSYSYGGADADRFAFRWPGTNQPVDSKGIPGVTIPWGIYAASPGGRYVAAFSDDYKLLVWESLTQTLVGRNPLPYLPERDGQPVGSRGRFTPAEMGFSPDGKEFAAVVGEVGNMYLINYHWESGTVTAFHPTITPWSGHRSVRYPNRYRLQFLEAGQGWLVEYGNRIIERTTGKRRGAFAFKQVDPRFYRMDSATFTIPRVISGNRALVVMQDPADLFHHQIQTVDLKVSD